MAKKYPNSSIKLKRIIKTFKEMKVLGITSITMDENKADELFDLLHANSDQAGIIYPTISPKIHPVFGIRINSE